MPKIGTWKKQKVSNKRGGHEARYYNPSRKQLLQLDVNREAKAPFRLEWVVSLYTNSQKGYQGRFPTKLGAMKFIYDYRRRNANG